MTMTPAGCLDALYPNVAQRVAVIVAISPNNPAHACAPMPGMVTEVAVSIGQEVKAGDKLVVLEAMKMENELRAARDGRVREVLVSESQSVEAGMPLVLIEPPMTQITQS